MAAHFLAIACSVLGVGFLCGCATSGPSSRPASDATTIIVTRHAEKAGDSLDPDLSPKGRARAAALAKAIHPLAPTAVYTTATRRSRQTAEPVIATSGAAERNLPPGTSPAKLAELLRAEPVGGTILIVSHSNVIPPLLRELGVTPTQTITEADFDLLWVVQLRTSGAKLLHEGPLPFSPQVLQR